MRASFSGFFSCFAIHMTEIKKQSIDPPMLYNLWEVSSTVKDLRETSVQAQPQVG